jgi:hypothetical protein
MQQQQRQQQGAGDGSSELLVVPFEFKTGKDYFSHKAQVHLLSYALRFNLLRLA